ncbi:MAG TPA: MFS transporter [Candidatus Elarobacter sp.]|nr:MFS transporter [Candidatus Elarobacter sp.]
MVLRSQGGRPLTNSRAAFRWLWAGQTTSVFGTAVSALAVPTIAILAMHASPLAVGFLGAVQFAAFPLLGLVAGVWIDRWSRRTTMLVADVARALALGSIPLAAYAHVLSYGQLVAVAAVVGVASVFFEIAYQSLVPSLVEPELLERANARLEFTNSAAQIAGSGLAGALISLIGAPLAVVVDACSYVVSVFALTAVRVRETHREGDAAARRAPFARELREGIEVVLAQPAVVRIAAATATTNFAYAMVGAVYLIFLYRTLHLSPALVGGLLAVANLGFAGALFAPRIGRRFGPGRTLVWSLGIAMSSQLLLPLALFFPPLPLVLAAELAVTMCVPVYNITQVSLRQRLIPAEQMGRANATLRTMVWGTLPFGTLIGGALGGLIGIVPTVVVATLLALTALPWLLTAPVRALRSYSSVMSAAENG